MAMNKSQWDVYNNYCTGDKNLVNKTSNFGVSLFICMNTWYCAITITNIHLLKCEWIVIDSYITTRIP